MAAQIRFFFQSLSQNNSEELSSPGRIGKSAPQGHPGTRVSMKTLSFLLGAFLLFLAKSNVPGYSQIHHFLHNEQA